MSVCIKENIAATCVLKYSGFGLNICTKLSFYIPHKIMKYATVG